MQEPWAEQPGELMRIQEAERAGVPFVLYRDAQDALRVLAIEPGTSRVTIGRAEGCELRVGWDERVSRSHAVIERMGDEWAVTDDGLSRNGTFVNESRVVGRRRLADRDVMRVGRTKLLMRLPAGVPDARTAAALSHVPRLEGITEAQRRVLTALARPSLEARGPVAPPSNDEIARELHLSVEAVKAHLRLLFRHFGIEDVPQVHKRVRLVELAIESGLVGDGRREPEPPTPA